MPSGYCIIWLAIEGYACSLVEASWNVMAHAQKREFVFRSNGWVHLNRQGGQFSRLLAAEVCASAFLAEGNAGYTMFRGSEKGTGYPLHSPVSPSLLLPCVTMCHHISTGVYCKWQSLDTGTLPKFILLFLTHWGRGF